MRVDAEVVVAVAAHPAPRKLEQVSLLAGELVRVGGGRVAAMEPHLAAAREQRLDDARAQAIVGLGRGAVRRMAVGGKHVERRRGADAALFVNDLLEAPVRVRAAQLVQRHAGEPPRLVERAARLCRSHVALQPRSAPRTPIRVQRHGMSTSWLRAIAKRAPNHRGGSIPRRCRSRSSGGSSGSRHGPR